MENKSSISKLVQRQSSDWQKWADGWKLLVGSPSRPSQGDLHLIAQSMVKAIKNLDKPKIVVLGSTPELRDLCAIYAEEYGAEVMCVELLEVMRDAMSQLMFKVNKKEKVVFANWLSTGLPDDYADVIVGDLTDGNISFDLKDKYFSEMRRILKKGGLYVSRAVGYIDEKKAKPMLSYDQILKRLELYREKVLNGELSIHKASCLFAGELAWDSWYKNAEGKFSLVYYKKEIEQMDKIKDGTVIKSIVDGFHKVYDSILTKYWDFYDLQTMLNTYNKYFTDVKYDYATDYPTAKFTPIFKMTKK